MVELTAEFDTDFELQHNLAAAVEEIHRSYLQGRRRFMGERRPARSRADRRVCERHPIGIPFYLFPMQPSENGLQPDWERLLQGVTRDISPRGLGFCCDMPLDQPLWLTEFDCPKGTRVLLVIEIRWRQKKSSHCFLAGARFLGCWGDPEWSELNGL
jgi:hypothetical protein